MNTRMLSHGSRCLVHLHRVVIHLRVLLRDRNVDAWLTAHRRPRIHLRLTAHRRTRIHLWLPAHRPPRIPLHHAPSMPVGRAMRHWGTLLARVMRPGSVRVRAPKRIALRGGVGRHHMQRLQKSHNDGHIVARRRRG